MKKNSGYVSIPKERLEYLLNEGLTIQQIAGLYYVSHPTIINRMKEHGIKIERARFYKNKEVIKKIKEGYYNEPSESI
jgi:hypothetical protein